MGSNPISPTSAVFDTSPLQALHRCDALRFLPALGVEIAIPRSVFDEMQVSLAMTGPARVPRLDEHPWLRVLDVGDDEVAAAGATFIGPHRSTASYGWFGRQVDRPELDAILLAKRRDARLVMEDSDGVRCARDLGVPVIGVAMLLVELEAGRHFDDADLRARRVLDTGYYSRELEWLSRRVFP